MDPLTMAAIGAGVGILKGELIDKPKADHQRKVEATKARWSPWTGMQPNQVQEADPFGSAIQGGMTGAMMGQGMQQTAKMNELMEAQKAALQADTVAPAAGAQLYVPGQGLPPYANQVQPQPMGWLGMQPGPRPGL